MPPLNSRDGGDAFAEPRASSGGQRSIIRATKRDAEGRVIEAEREEIAS
jgi:hypothetical protein